MKFSTTSTSFITTSLLMMSLGRGEDDVVVNADDDNEFFLEPLFVPTENWIVPLPNARGASDQLFYDPATELAWVVFNIEEFQTNRRLTRLCSVDTTSTTRSSNNNNTEETETVDFCVDIPESVENFYVSAEACYLNDDDDDAITMDGIAIVISQRNSNNIVVYYYNTITKSFTATYVYEGQNYVGSNLAKPAFITSDDCNTMFYTLTDSTNQFSNEAFSVAVSTTSFETFWQTDISTNRYAGFGVSNDNTKLYGCVNEISSDFPPNFGIFELDANTGTILQEYLMDNNNGTRGYQGCHTNVILDDDDNAYIVDDALGLVKFDTTDLSAGPLWSTRISNIENQGYRHPSFNPDYTYIFASEGYNTSSISTMDGTEVWNIGHSQVTGNHWAGSNIQWGPSAVAPNGEGAIHFTSAQKLQSYDAVNGELLWTYGSNIYSPVVISENTTIAIRGSSVVSLNTLLPTPPPTMIPTTTTPTPIPTSSPIATPTTTPAPIDVVTPSPTMAIATPAPIDVATPSPTPVPTPQPTTSGSATVTTTAAAAILFLLIGFPFLLGW